MHLVAAHKTNGLSFYQPLWSKQMYNCLFCGDFETFHILAGYLVTKVGFFYFHHFPIILCKALKIPLQSEMTFWPLLPLKKNGKYFLLSSREASHYQEHFSKWASSGINVNFSSFYILSITADSIWKVNSGFTIVQKSFCTNNTSLTNQAKICLVLFSIPYSISFE